MPSLNQMVAAGALALLLGTIPAGVVRAAATPPLEQEQAATGTPTAVPTPRPTATRGLRSLVATPAAAPAATRTPVTASTAPLSNAEVITLTVPAAGEPDASIVETGMALTATTPATDTAPITAAPAAPAPAVTATPSSTVAAGLQGTVVANRTQLAVRFFAEGSTYTLDPEGTLGLSVARPTAVLNLYNCDAALGDQQEGCFWDPYLLTRDGFYEIVRGSDAGSAVGLVLREADAPPSNQVWIQNRTGKTEEIYFGTQMREIAAAGVQEFTVDSGGVGVFYLRTCVTSPENGSVCEWAAHSAQPGAYYALVEETFSGGLPGTTVSNLELLPIVSEGDATPAVVAEPQTVCRLAVPALNVRSGPGLNYDIVKKVRSTDIEIATVLVTGRTEDATWLQVDERVAAGGWVIAGVEYVTCDGDVLSLPVVAASELPPTPTPLPTLPADVAVAPIVELPAEGAAPPATDPAAQPAADATPTSANPDIPSGLAQLTVINVFDREIRFTLDQRYRVEEGPSEYDLQPGQSVTLLVYPGAAAFTASSPWEELAGNTQIFLNPDEARSISIYWYYDSGEDVWVMQVG